MLRRRGPFLFWPLLPSCSPAAPHRRSPGRWRLTSRGQCSRVVPTGDRRPPLLLFGAVRLRRQPGPGTQTRLDGPREHAGQGPATARWPGAGAGWPFVLLIDQTCRERAPRTDRCARGHTGAPHCPSAAGNAADIEARTTAPARLLRHAGRTRRPSNSHAARRRTAGSSRIAAPQRNATRPGACACPAAPFGQAGASGNGPLETPNVTVLAAADPR